MEIRDHALKDQAAGAGLIVVAVRIATLIAFVIASTVAAVLMFPLLIVVVVFRFLGNCIAYLPTFSPLP